MLPYKENSFKLKSVFIQLTELLYLWLDEINCICFLPCS